MLLPILTISCAFISTNVAKSISLLYMQLQYQQAAQPLERTSIWKSFFLSKPSKYKLQWSSLIFKQGTILGDGGTLTFTPKSIAVRHNSSLKLLHFPDTKISTIQKYHPLSRNDDKCYIVLVICILPHIESFQQEMFCNLRTFQANKSLMFECMSA